MGKLAGNTVIETYAKVLIELVNKYPHLPILLGRFGGDEFMWLIVSASKNEAIDIFEELRRTIPLAIKEALNTPDLESTISMGAVTVQPDDNPITLIQRADNNLKKAKADRNKLVFVDSSI